MAAQTNASLSIAVLHAQSLQSFTIAFCGLSGSALTYKKTKQPRAILTFEKNERPQDATTMCPRTPPYFIKMVAKSRYRTSGEFGRLGCGHFGVTFDLSLSILCEKTNKPRRSRLCGK